MYLYMIANCKCTSKLSLKCTEYYHIKKCFNADYIEIINNKARHNLKDAKCRWHSDRLDGAVSFRESLGQTKVMQIRQVEWRH